MNERYKGYQRNRNIDIHIPDRQQLQSDNISHQHNRQQCDTGNQNITGEVIIMLSGKYNAIKNAHARNAIQTSPDITSASSGFGDAESTQGIDVRIRAKPPVQDPTIKKVKDLDDTMYLGKGKGPQIAPDQFPSDFYIGEESDYGI